MASSPAGVRWFASQLVQLAVELSEPEAEPILTCYSAAAFAGLETDEP